MIFNFLELSKKEFYPLLTKVCIYVWNQANWTCSLRNLNSPSLCAEKENDTNILQNFDGFL